MKLNLHDTRFVISAVKESQYPDTPIPEIAFAGRSNVGKSSLINKLVNRKSLARTSASPGKTATINFYSVNDSLHLVDLPGYGFAKVSQQEKKRWGEMINHYLETRQQLAMVVQLVDLRHPPTADDKMMFRWICENGFTPMVVATKRDKLRPSQIEKAIETVKNELQTDAVFPFSAVTGYGVDEIWKEFYNLFEEEE